MSGRTTRRVGWRIGLVVVLVTTLGACTADEDRDPAAAPGGRSTSPSVDEESPSTSETPDSVDDSDVEANLRETIGDAVDGGLYPGMLVLVRSGDRTTVLAGGVADQSTGEPLTAEHRFVAGAVTQPVLAATVLRLVEEGELDLDDTVATWLPGLLEDGRRITVEQLLTHTSGLANFGEAPGFERLIETQEPDPAELVRRAESLEPAFAPGDGPEYSPTNPVVLGLLVEKATGEPLAATLEEWIFRPLRMRHSSLAWGGRSTAPVAHGYSEDEDVTESNHAAWAGAAGGVVSTVGDVRRFFDALWAGEVVGPELTERMRTPLPGQDPSARWQYGWGVGHVDFRCGRAVGDNGYIAGYMNEAWTLLSSDREVVVMANTYDEMTSTGDVTRAVEQALCP